MKFQEYKSLKELNTFGIDVSARYFSEFSDLTQLDNALELTEKIGCKHLILGGGSNVLFTENFDGVILKNDFKGIELINEDSSAYYVRGGAGETWHDFVLFCIDNNFAGIENLSLIPGTVGASPIQNIGAYGVELKDVFWELKAVRIKDGIVEVFNKQNCEFNYRDSVFKNKFKGTHIITEVILRLPKEPKLNTSYGAIENELNKLKITNPTIKQISEAVITIRESKLPNPKEIGNAGSFFKNPVVKNTIYFQLKEKFPQIVGYPSINNQTKLAAGWLIENCGWKGKSFGNFGVHKNQSLVLVNYGNATGKEIYNLSEKIMASVSEKFNVALEREVWVI